MTSDNGRPGYDSDLLAKTAPLDVRRPVDETQSARQAATAPQPKIGTNDEGEISASDLDEAWASLASALRSADEDFDPAAAYTRLSRALPRELVAMPLAEPVPVRRGNESRFEIRDLALGALAMGAVCAALAGLAVFGPGLERRTEPRQKIAGSGSPESRSGVSSASSGAAWSDVRWEEKLLALADELHAERLRIQPLDRRSLGPSDERLKRLERNVAQTRDSFGPSAGF